MDIVLYDHTKEPVFHFHLDKVTSNTIYIYIFKVLCSIVSDQTTPRQILRGMFDGLQDLQEC